jgi:hypothetical protein
MPTHDFLTVAASAYENGRTAGQVFIFLLIAAVLYRFLLRDWLTRRVTRPVRAAIAGVGIVAVVLVGVATARGDTDPDLVRAQMVAGCVDTAGAEARDYCKCLADEVLERNGTSREQLDALDAEMRKTQQGGPPPAVLTAAIEACVG